MLFRSDYELAKQRSVTLLMLSLGLGLFSAGVTLLLGPMVVSMYNLSPETVEIALAITRLGALIVFFQSIALIGMVGVLRAGGDAKFVLLCEVVFLWFVAVPAGFYTGLVLGWPAAPVFLLLKCDEILKSLITMVRIVRFRWLRDVTGR